MSVRIEQYTEKNKTWEATFVLVGSSVDAISFKWPTQHQTEKDYWDFKGQTICPDGCVGAAIYEWVGPKKCSEATCNRPVAKRGHTHCNRCHKNWVEGLAQSGDPSCYGYDGEG